MANDAQLQIDQMVSLLVAQLHSAVLDGDAQTTAVAADHFDVCEAIAALFPEADVAQRKQVYQAYQRQGPGGTLATPTTSSAVSTPTPPVPPLSAISPVTNTEPLSGGAAAAAAPSEPSSDAPVLHAAASSISFLCAGAAAGLIVKETSVLASELLSAVSPASSLRLKSPLHDEDPRLHASRFSASASALGGVPAQLRQFSPLVLLNDRCPSDMLPWLGPEAIPRRPPRTITTAVVSAAWELYETTEKSLSKGRIGSEWSEAVGLFEEAGKQFEAAAGALSSAPHGVVTTDGDGEEEEAHHRLAAIVMAGNCYVRAADCLRCLRDVDQMSSQLEQAGLAYSSAFPDNTTNSAADDSCNDAALSMIAQASVQAFTQAIYVARAAGRNAKAARMARRGAEAAVRCRRFDDAVTLLYRACDIYDKELGMGAEARAVMTRAVAISVVDMSNLSIAIDALEKLADVSIPEEQPLVLFRAMLCRLACLPGITGNDTNDALSDCVYALDQYTDLCVGLCGGKENTCLKQILRGVEENDPVRVENAAEAYVSTHSMLEEWIAPLLRIIWHRTVERLAHRTEHLRDAS